MGFKSSQYNPNLQSAMKTKLMFAALLASASLVQAGPPITPAKIKRPLHLSQVTSIFRRSEPSVTAQQAGVPAQQASAPVQQKSSAAVQQGSAAVPSAAGDTSTAVPVTSPVSRKVHLNTFRNHPKTAPGPK